MRAKFPNSIGCFANCAGGRLLTRSNVALQKLKRYFMKRKIYTFAVCSAIFTLAAIIVVADVHAQVVSTIAGTGGSGYTGDGGAATAATLGVPSGITVDGAGNLYFTDYSNNVVRKIDLSGNISTVAGSSTATALGDGGPATAAYLYSVVGVVSDAAGNLYIADYGQNRVRKVNTSGIITTVAGTGTSGWTGDGGAATAAKLNGPYGLALDASGNLYIADRYNNRIRKVDAATGNITTVAGDGFSGSSGDGGAATAARLNDPLAVAVDGAGNLFISDYSNYRIRKVNSSGIISTYAGTGLVGTTGDGGLATVAKVRGVIGLCTDAAGDLYCSIDASTGGNKIRVVRTSGIIETYAGTGLSGFSGDGGDPLSAQFYNVKASVVDPAGNLFLCDAGNYRIRKISAPNHVPSFVNGAAQTMSSCQDGGLIDINAKLAVNDIDPSQPKNWSVVTAPTNGTLVATYTTSSGGTSLTPTGLTYVSGGGYSGPDMFSVQVYDGVAYDTTVISVTVNPKPTPSVTVAGTTLTVTGSYTTYQWYNGSSAIAGATGSSYTATTSGSYVVEVVDANGCNGGSAPQSVSVTGVNDAAATMFSVFPNPASGNFVIALSTAAAGHTDVVITDVVGRTVQEYRGVNEKSINASIAQPGIYNVAVICDGITQRARVVVR